MEDPMSTAHATAVANTNGTDAAAAVVEAFLDASMVPDPQTAARYIADDLKITFTGGRKFSAICARSPSAVTRQRRPPGRAPPNGRPDSPI